MRQKNKIEQFVNKNKWMLSSDNFYYKELGSGMGGV